MFDLEARGHIECVFGVFEARRLRAIGRAIGGFGDDQLFARRRGDIDATSLGHLAAELFVIDAILNAQLFRHAWCGIAKRVVVGVDRQLIVFHRGHDLFGHVTSLRRVGVMHGGEQDRECGCNTN